MSAVFERDERGRGVESQNIVFEISERVGELIGESLAGPGRRHGTVVGGLELYHHVGRVVNVYNNVRSSVAPVNGAEHGHLLVNTNFRSSVGGLQQFEHVIAQRRDVEIPLVEPVADGRDVPVQNLKQSGMARFPVLDTTSSSPVQLLLRFAFPRREHGDKMLNEFR